MPIKLHPAALNFPLLGGEKYPLQRVLTRLHLARPSHFRANAHLVLKMFYSCYMGLNGSPAVLNWVRYLVWLIKHGILNILLITTCRPVAIQCTCMISQKQHPVPHNSRLVSPHNQKKMLREVLNRFLFWNCSEKLIKKFQNIAEFVFTKTSQCILFIAVVFSLSHIHGKFCIIPQIGKKTGLIIPKVIRTCHRYPIPI